MVAEAVAIYDETMAQLDAWKSDCFEIAKAWGFDDAAAYDFRAPSEFRLLRAEGSTDRKGPALDGFKGGDLIYGEQPFFAYTLHGRHPMTKERRKQLDAIESKHRPVEAKDGGSHWITRSHKQLICHRLAMFADVFQGGRISFSTCWKFNCGTLLVQLPIQKGKDGQHLVPAIPEGWSELRNSEVIELFDGHNRRAGVPAPESEDAFD